jgi:hypothetical protein
VVVGVVEQVVRVAVAVVDTQVWGEWFAINRLVMCVLVARK